MYDFAIIGLGPAGSTVARLLDKRYKVIAIDKKTENASFGFKKPCGGLLAPDAQKKLSGFNLTLPKDILVDPQIFAVRTIDLGKNIERCYQRFYINLDRDKFDRWLISLIPSSVLVEKGAIVNGIEKCDGFYSLTYLHGGEEKTVRAKNIIGADGSNSFVRKCLFPKKKIRRYMSIQQHFTEQNPAPFYSCLFDPAITDSYCWSVSKDGILILGGAFPVKNAKERFALLKEKFCAKGFALGEPLKTEACLVSRPERNRDFCVASNNAYFVGEAAGFISPSSLEGISFALDSAHILAKILSSNTKKPCKKYYKKTLPLRAKILLKRLKEPFLYNPFLRKLIMKSGLMSIEIDK